jgi:hypothetical protein
LAICGLTLIALAVAGCRGRPRAVEPQPGPVQGMPAAEADARAEAVRRNPAGYLQRVADKCRGLEQYTLRFTRCERRGLLQQRYGPEHMFCRFRRRPFSVRVQWLDKDSKYLEMAYVEGRADNRVRFVTRRWILGLLPPPQVNEVDLLAPVAADEFRRPLSEFGLERLMARTLNSYRTAGDDAMLTYEGLRQLPDGGATVHCLHLEYPPSRQRAPIQELYIDVVTDLPAGTILKLASGELDASYFYGDIDLNVRLIDADFLLDAERKR